MRGRSRIKSHTPEETKDAASSRIPRSSSSKPTPSFDNVISLHRTIGNQAVQRLFKSGVIQAKLRIGQPNDIYEQEADRVAGQVMQMPESQVQRQPEAEEEETFQAKTAGSALPGTASIVGAQINTLKGGGQPLPDSVRSFMEPRFGHDFKKVRVHTDSDANLLAGAVNASAFTVGKDVVFEQGQYAPATTSGRRLLAHELTHVVQQEPQSGSQLVLQRKGGADIKTIEWKAGVEMAENAAKNPKTKDIAKGYYKELVVRAAQKVTAPSPLVDKNPATDDILWSWTTTREYAATTDPKKVDKVPDDYWKWLMFNPGAVQKEEAFTISTILHELDHAAHAKALYDEWKKAGTKKKEAWADFYVAHFTKWTEKEIKIAKVGAVGALAGLPEKISPSAIEFRAYANQFVNYFHKVSTDKQEYMARAVILFYPLKIQKAEAKISDPTLDLSKARQQILDYFKLPPVKDKTQKDIIKIRAASELKSALFLFRPADDHAQIKKDFSDILDFPVDSEERKEARKNYKPEAL